MYKTGSRASTSVRTLRRLNAKPSLVNAHPLFVLILVLTTFPSGDSLLELKPEDLDALGVTKLGHRKKLLMEIRGGGLGLESSRSESYSVGATHL